MQALDKCRDSPPIDWPAAAYVLLGREDLAFSRLAYSRKSVELEPHMNVNMTCMSAPYMLNLHPVTIPSSISDTVQSEDNKLEDVDSVEGYVADGMEHIFNSGIQLRYGRDLRLNEVSLLILCMTENKCLQALLFSKYNPASLLGVLSMSLIPELRDHPITLVKSRSTYILYGNLTLMSVLYMTSLTLCVLSFFFLMKFCIKRYQEDAN